jgi:hypothetical protein
VLDRGLKVALKKEPQKEYIDFSKSNSQSGAISLNHPDEHVLGFYLIQFAEVLSSL